MILMWCWCIKLGMHRVPKDQVSENPLPRGAGGPAGGGAGAGL